MYHGQICSTALKLIMRLVLAYSSFSGKSKPSVDARKSSTYKYFLSFDLQCFSFSELSLKKKRCKSQLNTKAKEHAETQNTVEILR